MQKDIEGLSSLLMLYGHEFWNFRFKKKVISSLLFPRFFKTLYDVFYCRGVCVCFPSGKPTLNLACEVLLCTR